uniref:Uncharacterized protein n=1 Tax=Glossina pallidipes TaxID=7398 RepID=A0A1B0AD84_GLOPL
MELAEELRRHFVEFFDGFDATVKEYAKDMSEEQKADHEDFLKWFTEFKKIDGFGRQLDKFSEFFKFFRHK